LASGVHELMDVALFLKMRFDNIASNLANINTTAFKKDVLSFNQALSMEYTSKTDFTPGPAGHTGNPLDVALEGPGFFKIQTPKGIRYAQNGAFILNTDQYLVTYNGDIVLGENGPIEISGKHVSIGRDGQVAVDNAPVDKILVVAFREPELLSKEGNSYFQYQGEEKDIYHPEDVQLRQGYLERANVNPTEEMIKMVETLRAFESAQKGIQILDEITGKIVNDPGLIQ
jgi:flagellar basal-body rod protein FlgG